LTISKNHQNDFFKWNAGANMIRLLGLTIGGKIPFTRSAYWKVYDQIVNLVAYSDKT
jgi:hypothetical protein